MRSAAVRSNLLDHLIINKILVQKATADDKVQTKKLVDDGIEEARKSAPTPEAFDAQIKASGMTLDTIRTRAYEELSKHYEHRERNFPMALECARAARALEDSEALELRQRRLEAKCARTTRQPALKLNRSAAR